MNSFSDWKSNPIRQAFSNVNENRVNSYGSLENMLKGVLGDSFGKNFAPPQENPDVLAARALAEKMKDVPVPAPVESMKEEEPIQEIAHQIQEIPEVEEEEIVIPKSKAYRIFRDKDENFECNISIQGAGLASAQARIILDCDQWNFTFYGKLYKDGKCIVPLKRGIPLPEGTTGRARLEVVVDDQLFIPWEDEFIVEGSKKVKVELKEQKSVKVHFEK